MNEIRRIILNRTNLGCLIALSVLTGLLFYLQQWERWDASPHKVASAYQEMIDDYIGMEIEDAKELFSEELARYQMLGLVTAYQEQDEYEDLLAQCQEVYPELAEEIRAGEWDTGRTETVIIASEYVEEQIDALWGYEDYLQRIQDNADILQKSSLFSDSGTFQYRNIEKTREDYAHLMQKRLSISNNLAVDAYCREDVVWNISIIVYVLCVCIRLFDERRNGMWEVIYAAKGGRGYLAGRRLVALICAMLLFDLVTSGIRLGISVYLYGEFDSNSLLQTLKMYQECPWELSVGEFLVQNFFIRWIGMINLVCIVAGICSWYSNQNFAICGIIVIIAVELILYQHISEQSLAVWLKYLNLASFLAPDIIVRNYLNLSLGGYPVSISIILVYWYLFVLVSSSCFFVRGIIKKYPCVRWNPIEQICIFIRRRWPEGLTWTSVGMVELQKGMLWRHGIFLLVGYSVILFLCIRPVSLYETGKEAVLNRYYTDMQGKIDEKAINVYLDNEQKEIDQGRQLLVETTEKFQKGDIGEFEYTGIMLQLSSLPDRINALGEWTEKIETLKKMEVSHGVDGYLVNPFGYRWLLGDKSNWMKIMIGIMEIFVLIYVQIQLVFYDKRCEMEDLLWTAPGGRRYLYGKKMKIGFLTAIYLWAYGYFVRIRTVFVSNGNLSCLNASINCLDFMDNYPAFISIGCYLCGIAVVHLCFLLLIPVIMTVCKYRLGCCRK